MAAVKNHTIIFNTSKKQYGNPGSNMKKITQKYKGSTYKIGLNKETIEFDKLKNASLFVLASPREKFSEEELGTLRKYVDNGGNLLVFSSEGGDRKNGTNLNELLKGFGVSINNDSVMRTSFYKYFHPKEAYIHNGILNEEIVRVINGYSKEPKGKNASFLMGGAVSNNDDEQEKESKRTGADFVYVNGATLKVGQTSNAILSCGPLTYPSNKPICAVNSKRGGGKLMVFGSVDSMLDDYFELEENHKIFEFMLKYFLTDEVEFEFGREEVDKNDAQVVPDIAELADGLKSCFQESEDVPKDYTALFQSSLFKYDTDLIPEAVKLFESLGVKHQPLSLIVPQFETPLLGLAPAVFPPILKQLQTPNLQLFDLDDEFALEKVRMAQLTNKCENKDLEYFVREAGDMLGVSDKVKNRSEPKAILKFILEEIINFKKMNPN